LDVKKFQDEESEREIVAEFVDDNEFDEFHKDEV